MRLCEYFVELKVKTPNTRKYKHTYTYIYIYKHPLSKTLQFENIHKIYMSA